MDKKSLFPATAKATEADFNGIHENTIDGLKNLQEAIASENPTPTAIILKDDPPVINSPVVDIPAVPFAVNGIFTSIAAQSTGDLTVGADAKIGLYFRAVWQDVSENRDYLNTAGASPVVGNTSFVVGRSVVTSVVVMDPDAAPTPATDEIGVVKYAVIDRTGGTLTVDTHPTTDLWTVPVGTSPGNHAATHLPGGGDEIQLSTPLLDGLASADDTTTTRAALTDLSVNAASDYLVWTISGDNAVTPASKAVELLFRAHSETFESVDEGGNQVLGLKYSNPNNFVGSSNAPARVDHRHNLSTSANVTALRVLSLTASDMDQLHALTVPASIGTILSVSAFWLAPSLTNFPVIEAQAQHVGASQAVPVGARAVITGQQSLSMYVGQAICELSAAEVALVSATAGSVTWTSFSGSNSTLPTSGTLLVYISGLASGVGVLT